MWNTDWLSRHKFGDRLPRGKAFNNQRYREKIVGAQSLSKLLKLSFGDSVKLTSDVGHRDCGCEFKAGAVGTFIRIKEGTNSCICKFDTGDEMWGILELTCKSNEIVPINI